MKTWLVSNWFKVGWLMIALIIAISIAYYYVIYIPKRDQTQNILKEFQQQSIDTAKKKMQQDLQNCLSGAEKNYSSNWDNDCYSSGKQADCSLNNLQATRWQNIENQTKEDCFKEYPQ